MKLKHIAIRVKDLEKSIKFYEEIAGLKVDRRISSPPAELAFMATEDGHTQIELVNIANTPSYEGKGWFICFETDDLNPIYQLAKEKSLNPSEIQDPGDGTKYVYVYDPDGVSVQFRTFAT